MRFARRLDAVPPYLFAELERKITEKQRRGRGRDQPRDRRSRPADAASRWSRRWPTPRATPRTHQYPTNHGSRGAPRGRGRLLPRPLRRRARPGLGGRARARRQGGGRPRRAGAARPGRRLPLAGPRLSAVHVGARSSPARRCTTCRSPRRTASCPTSTRSRRDVLARANVLFLDYPNNPTGAVVAARLLRAGGRASPARTTWSSCTTTPTRSSASTATALRASSRRRARRRSASRSSRSRRAGT